MAYPRLSEVVPVGEWLPDQTSFNNAGANVVKNVVPYGKGYAPVRGLVGTSGLIAGEILGGFAAVDLLGSPHFFIGTATKLYKLVSNAWQDVTRASGGDYATAAGERWVFTQYGDNVVACNYTDEMQTFDLGTSTDFTDVAGAPQSRVLAVVNNFVATGNTYDATDDQKPSRVRWSGFDNISTWTPSVTTQSDQQDLPIGGPVRAVIGYDNYAIVMQNNSIRRMEYIGGSDIFSFTEVEPNRGCYVSGSVAAIGQSIFYYGEDGFFMFTGGRSTPIGHGKVDRWFAGDADFSKQHRFTAIIDPREKSYKLSYVSNESPDGNPDHVIVYHWAENRWSYFEQSLQTMFSSFSRNVDMDTDLDALDVSIDSDAPSLDSTEYKGGRPLINAITTSGSLGSFSGASLVAEIETTEVQLNPQGRCLVQEVQLVSDATSVVTSLKTRDKLADAEVEGDGVALNTYTATANVRKDARYHRAKMVVSGTWSFIDGVKLAWRPTGIR